MSGNYRLDTLALTGGCVKDIIASRLVNALIDATVNSTSPNLSSVVMALFLLVQDTTIDLRAGVCIV